MGSRVARKLVGSLIQFIGPRSHDQHIKSLRAVEFATGLIFGEGPRRHDGRLFISDMLAGWILSFDSTGRQQLVVDVPNRPNSMAFMPAITSSRTGW